MDYLKISELIFHEFDENNDIKIENGESWNISKEEYNKFK